MNNKKGIQSFKGMVFVIILIMAVFGTVVYSSYIEKMTGSSVIRCL